MGSAEDFPYDPRAVVERLDGLEKLRAVKDRSIAQMLYDLYFHAERNERCGRFAARERAREKTRETETNERNRACVESALRGVFGRSAQELANTYTDEGKRLDPASCAATFDAINRLKPEDRRRVRE